MRITLENVKGVSGTFDLDRKQIVTAPNGTGKTAISDGMKFLIAGHVPELGKRHTDTAQLMTGDSMTVRFEFDDGRWAERELRRSGASFTRMSKTSWTDGKLDRDGHAAILGAFGTNEQDILEAIDVRQLLAAPPAQRANRIESMLAVADGDGDQMELVEEMTLRKLNNRVDEDLENWKGLRSATPKDQVSFIEKVMPVLRGKYEEGGLNAVAVKVNEQKRKASKGSKEKAAAQKEIEEKRKQIREYLGDVTRAYSEERQEYEKARDDLIRRRGVIESRLLTGKGAESKLKAAQQDLDEATERLEELRAQAQEDFTDPRPDLLARLDQIDAKIEDMRGRQALQKELAEIVTQIEKFRLGEKVLRVMEWGVQRARERELAKAKGPFIETMEAFLKAAGRVETPFFKATKSECTIGWINAKGEEVSVNVLSRGEWVIFATALITAIAKMRELPFSLIMAEAGEANPAHFDQLIAGIDATLPEHAAVLVLHWFLSDPAFVGTQEFEGWSVLNLKPKDE